MIRIQKMEKVAYFDAIDELAWHAADVSSAVSLNVSFVFHTTQGDSDEASAQSAGSCQHLAS
jgi:hypothetical protein